MLCTDLGPQQGPPVPYRKAECGISWQHEKNTMRAGGSQAVLAWQGPRLNWSLRSKLHGAQGAHSAKGSRHAATADGRAGILSGGKD